MDLCSLTFAELTKWLEERKEKSFRAKQIWDWVFQKRCFSFDAMRNLNKPLIDLLKRECSFPVLKLEKKEEGKEVIKFLWHLKDDRCVESVFISSLDRKTVCVSSQVGCACGCLFCASGKEGFFRNLTAAEIVEQVLLVEPVSNIVFMGMGEPLLNFEAVVKSISILHEGLGISERKITVSTVGIVDKILLLAGQGLKINLALSLHAPDDELRRKLIPSAKKNGLRDIFHALDVYFEKTGRDISYEYILISGINDRKEHAEKLAKLLKGRQGSLNLIPCNPVEGVSFKRPSSKEIDAFKSVLVAKGIAVTQRYAKGQEIVAACGQLACKR